MKSVQFYLRLGNKIAIFALHMTARELLGILHKDGWFKFAQKGSHMQLKHKIKTGKITVPMHNQDIPKGTLHAILK